jgi:hypothetical protein
MLRESAAWQRSRVRREQTGENDVALQPLRRDVEWAAFPSCSPVRCGLPVAAQSVSQPDEVAFDRLARAMRRLWPYCRSKDSEQKWFGDSKRCSSRRSPGLLRKPAESGPSASRGAGQVHCAILSRSIAFRSPNRTWNIGNPLPTRILRLFGFPKQVTGCPREWLLRHNRDVMNSPRIQSTS